MEAITIFLPVILSFFILMVPSWMRFYFALAVALITILVTSIPAVLFFLNPEEVLTLEVQGPAGAITLTIDSLSGFFILVTNLTMLTGLIYSKGYLKPYLGEKAPARISLHYFSYIWLHLSMLGVLMLRDGLAFLISWELMAVSSFMLILFEAENRTTLKTAVSYLIQMHIGLVFLTIAFLMAEAATGVFGFDALKPYFSDHSNILLFLIFFAGFSIKAGFIPLHTWLPEAHPAAPSHVSGIMSGVMIKMGIYGIIRVLISVQRDLGTIGIIILIIGALTAFYGIMMALSQRDLKRVLAYSTIENVGIIGIGIGIATLGLGLKNPWLIYAGLAGALLHVLNHSLFKSLLFFSAGSVYTMYHTRDMEKLGGVIHRMPRTTGLFLIGALAISGLPPLNGFISEILIYIAILKGLPAASIDQSIVMMLTLIFLVLTGGLALFCFTKAFGITFLGSPRSDPHTSAKDVGASMTAPMAFIAGLILLIGVAPMILLRPLFGLVSNLFGTSPGTVMATIQPVFTDITRVGLILLLFFAGLMILRHFLLKRRVVAKGPTWGCGYTAPNVRQQYTAHSFASNFGELARPVLPEEVAFETIREDEIFPSEPRKLTVQLPDSFERLSRKISGFSMLVLKKLARLQTGNIQHYILYAFVFILVIFALLFLNLI